jgi:Ca2+-binding RTX toxin-like protein
LVFTSRNGTAESLYGITATTERSISTPGHRQSAIINVEDELAKAADLEPFWIGHNDVIYGGLGNDFIHAGMGDDAVSGAEALEFYYVDDPLTLLATLYQIGNVLQYNFAVGSSEFAYYNRYDPWRRIHLRTVPVSGEFLRDRSGNRIDFLLNFEARITPSDPYSVIDDGRDTIFGDGGNDWIVGGTGHDRMFGGWGDDLLQADDDLDSTFGSGDDDANNIPDAGTSAVTFSDIAYGGAGRDILIANTVADRLIDWVGQFNSYVVPFRSQGAPTISRGPSPHIFAYLYALSAASGIDLTLGRDVSRNGEPYGELGLVTQKDDDWKAQTGRPASTSKGKDKNAKASGDEAATLFAQEAGNQRVSADDAPEPDVALRHPRDADVELADTPATPGRGRGRQRLWSV